MIGGAVATPHLSDPFLFYGEMLLREVDGPAPWVPFVLKYGRGHPRKKNTSRTSFALSTPTGDHLCLFPYVFCWPSNLFSLGVDGRNVRLLIGLAKSKQWKVMLGSNPASN